MKGANGFTLIEVLIATLILAAAALTVQAAYGQYLKLHNRLARAQTRYEAALSIRDALATAETPPASTAEGNWNELPYRYEARAIGTRKRQIRSPLAMATGEATLHRATLYEVALTLAGRDYAFTILHTETRHVR